MVTCVAALSYPGGRRGFFLVEAMQATHIMTREINTTTAIAAKKINS